MPYRSFRVPSLSLNFQNIITQVIDIMDDPARIAGWV